MLSILTFLSLITLSLSGSDDCKYTVTVVRAEGLIEGDSTWLYTNDNDAYVEIFGYGTGGDDKIKEYSTSTIDNNDRPEWNEKFVFDEAADDNGAYQKVLFKIYDSDKIFGIGGSDFLGETRELELSVVKSCDEIYAADLTVYYDDEAQGKLFIEIEKDGCTDDKDSSSSSSSSDDDKDEEKDEEKDEDKDEDKDYDKDEDKEERGGKKSRLL